MDKTATPISLSEELAQLLNKHSVENRSGTPDFILAKYLLESLNVFNKIMVIRDKWHGNTSLSYIKD